MDTGKLKTVAEHEALQAAKPHATKPGYPSGVACPHCGTELLKAIGGVDMHQHYQGRKPVFCRGCGHTGTIA